MGGFQTFSLSSHQDERQGATQGKWSLLVEEGFAGIKFPSYTVMFGAKTADRELRSKLEFWKSAVGQGRR